MRKPAQQSLPFKQRGGKRPGAGRPPKGPRSGTPHMARPTLKPRHPVHVVLRTTAAVGSLRRRHIFHAFRWATHVTARRDDFRIVQISVQRTHVHLIVEADNKRALARGMQGFQISAAKHVNAALSRSRSGPRRRGAVFADRYHATVITSPRQAHHALSYVMNNWRKHGEDHRLRLRAWRIDWFSSAADFPDWAEYGDEPLRWRAPPTYEPFVVRRPHTWLLRQGWKRHGEISCFEVPAPVA
jgi:REP element-mobilizing transposase RayT